MTPHEMFLRIADDLDCVDNEEMAGWLAYRIAAAGYAVVPAEPTEAMIEAAIQTRLVPQKYRPVTAYKRMIAAAQEPTE